MIENFKEIAEKILNGKSKGYFVRADGGTISSKNIKRCQTPKGIYYELGYYTTYSEEGRALNCSEESCGIVDYQEEGTCTPLKTWEEYAKEYEGKLYYIQDDGKELVGQHDVVKGFGFDQHYRNTLPTKEMAEKVLAYMQLLSLRYEMIGNYEPLGYTNTHCIVNTSVGISVAKLEQEIAIPPLSFPNKDSAIKFKRKYFDLIQKANGLF